MPTYSQRRLIAAIAVSVAVHAAIVAWPSGSRRAERAGGVPLVVLLGAQVAETREEAPPPALQPNVSLTDAAATPSAREQTMTRNATVATVAIVPTPAVAAEPVGPASSANVPEARDPAIYGALQLDEYPRALTALDLTGVAGLPGKLRATVLIDESGAVSSVRQVQEAPDEVQRAAKALLLAARFSPAKREGRLVKAQLVVELTYGALRAD